MKHVFGINKRLNARRAEERRQEEEEEAAFEREEERWEREDSIRFERQQRERRERDDSGSAVNVRRRRSLVEISKANNYVAQAMTKANYGKQGLMMFQRALSIYLPALKKNYLTKEEREAVMRNTKDAMQQAEKLKREILQNRRGVVDGKLYFNGGMAEYAWLDNIACQVPIHVDGVTYPSTEHYFQSQKFAGTSLEETIRTTKDPLEAKRFGRSSGLRSDWENIKIDVMLKAVAAKFDQHDDLRMKLVDTTPHPIVEHARDSCWGNGIYDEGKNLFGKILTTVRDGIVKSARSKKNIAIMTLHQAIDADRRLDRTQALRLYATGIEDYLSAAKDLPSSERQAGFTLVSQCIERAKNVKRIQETPHDIPVVPFSLVQYIPSNGSAPQLPLAYVISDSSV
jgi:N-glycosidase YbiA